MSKLNSPSTESRSKRISNISLPERASPLEITPSILRRNTLTEESSSSKLRKKLKLPTTPVIHEDEAADDTVQSPSFAVENETKKLKRNESIASRVSTISSKSTKAYDNKAFEGTTKPNDSRNNSVQTNSRAPSIQSLEVYREQYCCCAKRTRCEKYLLVTVTVLVIIIVVLIVVVCVLSKNNPNKVNQLFNI